MIQVQIFTHGYIFITSYLCLLHGRRAPTIMINKVSVSYIMQQETYLDSRVAFDLTPVFRDAW